MFIASRVHILFNEKVVFESLDGIDSVLFWDNRLIVCYRRPESNQNVCMIDSNGDIIWEIEKEVTNASGESRSFSGLSIDKDMNFWAYNSGGYNCQYDPSSGKILKYEFVK